MLGVFVALDLFLFYVFWEIMLIPMYLLIGIWGGPRRIYATVKFVVYTLVGSLLMLVAILAVAIAYAVGRAPSRFELRGAARLRSPTELQALAFVAFFLAFAIKVPMWPFHTWLPDAHVEAPTAGSMHPRRRAAQDGRLRLPALLAAAPARRRARVCAPIVIGLAVIAILYGALVSDGAARPQEADRLLERQPHGLRHAGHLRASTSQGLQGASSR